MPAAAAEQRARSGMGPPLADPLPIVRRAVRHVLEATPEYSRLPADQRRALASAMVRVGCTAANLVREEVAGENEIAELRPPSAKAFGGPEFGTAASKVAGTTRAILNAVSFPRFVTDLINGVFKAMNDSNQAQLDSYLNLLNAVAYSTEGFADANMGVTRARQWIVDHYPDAYEFESDIEPLDPEASPEEQAEHAAEQRDVKLQVRSGGKPPSEDVIRMDLGMGPADSVPSLANPESGLVPLVRSRLAKMRQEMLATLVQMGMQRIVIDSGRIYASMRFHIDTRDAIAHDDASRFGLENEVTGSGSFGYGPWGASASVRNNVSYVSTQRNQSTSEMNTDLELNSAVEINFKSDYLPLNKLATPNQAAAIRANSRNPEAESDAGREKRISDARAAETKRSDSLTELLKPASRPSDAPAGSKPAEKPAEKPDKKPPEKPAEKPPDKPAEKPAGKPAEKPPEKPADKPAGKPADQPAEKPAEKPGEKPAAPRLRPAPGAK
jgi:hypothetical protein